MSAGQTGTRDCQNPTGLAACAALRGRQSGLSTSGRRGRSATETGDWNLGTCQPRSFVSAQRRTREQRSPVAASNCHAATLCISRRRGEEKRAEWLAAKRAGTCVTSKDTMFFSGAEGLGAVGLRRPRVCIARSKPPESWRRDKPSLHPSALAHQRNWTSATPPNPENETLQHLTGSGVGPSNLSGWVKSFHHLFNKKKFEELKSVSDVVVNQLPILRPTEFTMIANHYARCGFRDRRFWRRFCLGIREGCHDIDGKDLSILLNSLAQVGYKNDETLHFLADECRVWIPHNDAKNLALTANALVRLDFTPPGLMTALFSRARELLALCNVIDLGNFANASKKTNFTDVEFLRRLCDRACQLAPVMNEHNIASIVFALGHHQYRCPKLLEAFSLQLSRLGNLRMLKAQYIPSIIAAFGSLKYQDCNFLHFAQGQISSRVTEFEAVDLSMILTGLARLQISTPVSMLSDLVREAVCRIENGQLDHRGQSNVIMAMSKLGFRNEQELWTRITTDLGKTLPRLHGEDLSNVAIALSKVAGDPEWRPDVFQSISACTLALGSTLTPRALSGIASAFSRTGCRDCDLLSALASWSLEKMPHFNSRDTIQLLDSMLRLEYLDRELYQAIAQHAERYSDRFTDGQVLALRGKLTQALTKCPEGPGAIGAVSGSAAEARISGDYSDATRTSFAEVHGARSVQADSSDELRIALDSHHILRNRQRNTRKWNKTGRGKAP